MVETGKFQQRSDSLKLGLRQLKAINKKPRAAVDECKYGKINGYPDLEITNIDEFIGDLVESTETLMVIHRSIKYGRIRRLAVECLAIYDLVASERSWHEYSMQHLRKAFGRTKTTASSETWSDPRT